MGIQMKMLDLHAVLPSSFFSFLAIYHRVNSNAIIYLSNVTVGYSPHYTNSYPYKLW